MFMRHKVFIIGNRNRLFKCVQVFVIEINYCGNVIVTVDYFDDCVKNYKVRCFHGSSTLGLTRRTCNTCDCITIQYNTTHFFCAKILGRPKLGSAQKQKQFLIGKQFQLL